MQALSFAASVLLLTLISLSIVISVILSLRFLHFPDLTIDGTVATSGAAFAVVLVATHSSLLAILAAVAAGFVCGLVTMLLHERFGIGKLLSGILVLTALYSVDLRVMDGSNVSILGVTTWLDTIGAAERQWLGAGTAMLDPFKILALAGVLGAVAVAIVRFFHARSGVIIRGIGDNERAVARLAIPVGRYKYVGLGLANAVAGFGGALMVTNQGFADVGMGAGSLVLGLAALIVGEKLVGPWWGGRDLVKGLLVAGTIGMLLYQMLWLLVLRVGLSPTDLKLFTSLLVVVTLVWDGKQTSPFYEGRAF